MLHSCLAASYRSLLYPFVLLSFLLYLVPSTLFLPFEGSVGCLRFLLGLPCWSFLRSCSSGFSGVYYSSSFRWTSSRLRISALPWVVLLSFLWFLSDYPPSSPSPAAISPYPSDRLPLGSLSRVFATRSTPLGSSFDFACFPFGLALSHSFLSLALTSSGTSAGVVLSSLVQCFLLRYCLSLALVGGLPSFGLSPFSPFCLLFSPSAPLPVPNAVLSVLMYSWFGAFLFSLRATLPLLS